MIGVVGLLAAVAVPLVTGVPDAAKKRKLEQDVVIVNNAIDSYLASGGDAENLTSDSVISALKTRVTGGMPAEMTGPRGPFLDPTVITNPTDFSWSALFTTDPRPRFYVAQSASGVIFGKGPAVAVGGVAERSDQARPSWLWTYGEASPPAERTAFVPLAVDTGAASTNIAQAAVTLGAPTIAPSSLTANIWGFPLQVTITNTNPAGSSRVYYKIGNGSYTLFDNAPFNVDPGASVAAVCVSLDPSRYYNSVAVTNTYSVIPLALAVRINSPASVTYAQAGGAIIGVDQLSPAQATITLEDTANLVAGNPDNLLTDDAGEDKYIPASYLKSANFTVRYTSDGSDPVTSQTAQSAAAFNGYFSPIAVSLALAAWGTNSVLPIRAAAVAVNTNWFASSPSVSNVVSISKTALGSPSVLPTNQVVTFSVTVTMGAPTNGPLVGTNSPIRYTTNNSAPSVANGSTYAAPFSLSSFGANEVKTVRAVAVPASYSNWLDPSPETMRVFTGTPFAGSGIPSGALIGGGTINSTFNGNITYPYPTNGVVANIDYYGGTVINGSIYVPGTPRISKNSAYWSLTNDAAFSSQIGGIVEGMSVSPRVVDMGGNVNPTNYTITFNSTARITGKVFRQAERYSLVPLNTNNFPVKTSSASLSLSGPIAAPLNPTNVANVTINTASVGAVTLLPGTYGNMTANNGTSFVLGDSGNPNNVQIYNFDSLTLNSSSDIQIVGPVILNIRSGFSINTGSVFGNVAHPEWLQINVWNGDVAANSGSSIYGRIYAPNNTVALNAGSSLTGAVTAKTLNLYSTSIVFSLSPASSPGM